MEDDKNKRNKDDNNNRNKDEGNKENRGFAAMDPEKQREIASEGGKASHKNDDR